MINYIAWVLLLFSITANGAKYEIPLNIFNYVPGQASSFIYPESGAVKSSACGENRAKYYPVRGDADGPGPYWWHVSLREPAIVTLYNAETNHSARVKVYPLGWNKGTYQGWIGGDGSGPYCHYSGHGQLWGKIEKNLGVEDEVRLNRYRSVKTGHEVALAFELLDLDVQPGLYKTIGGYSFKSSEFEVTSNSLDGTLTTPFIPMLALRVGNVFKVEMLSTSINLSPTGTAHEMAGSAYFWINTNRKFKITMRCSPNHASSEGDCNMEGDPNLKLKAKIGLNPDNHQFVMSDIKHNQPALYDSDRFTTVGRRYPGRLDFKLDYTGYSGSGSKQETIYLDFEQVL